jgi:hypothetical protein
MADKPGRRAPVFMCIRYGGPDVIEGAWPAATEVTDSSILWQPNVEPCGIECGHHRQGVIPVKGV